MDNEKMMNAENTENESTEVNAPDAENMENAGGEVNDLDLESMEDVCGGAIVKSRGKYYAACDPSYDSSLYSKGYRTKEAAEKIAEKNGWSKEEYTRAEYIKAMGRDTSIW